MIHSIPRLTLLASLLAASLSASAFQVLEGADGRTLMGKISQKELTRVMVEGERIRRVTGNAGEFFLEKDEEKGQIYLRPAAEGATKPINLFVATNRSTFTLLLQPVDLPAETIVIKPPRNQGEPTRIERSGSYVRSIKNLLLAMAGDALPRDMDVREFGQDVALWQEARFTLTRKYVGQRLVGEKYLLTNVSAAPMVIAEQELYKPGVIAVSVENMSLGAGESSNVFIIRERSDRD